MYGKHLLEFGEDINTNRSSNCFDLGERRGNRVQDR
jgi:hypothetical protein